MRPAAWPLWLLLASLPAWLAGEGLAMRAAAASLAVAAGLACQTGFGTRASWTVALLVAVAAPPLAGTPAVVTVVGIAATAAVVAAVGPIPGGKGGRVAVLTAAAGAPGPQGRMAGLAAWTAPAALLGAAVLLPQAAHQSGLQAAAGWIGLALLIPAQVAAIGHALREGPVALLWPAFALVATAAVVALRMAGHAAMTAFAVAVVLLAVAYAPSTEPVAQHMPLRWRPALQGGGAALVGWGLRALW